MKVEHLTDIDIDRIGRKLGDSFFEHNYEDGDLIIPEIGYKEFFNTNDKMRRYITAVIKKGYKCKQLYSTSENGEGYMVISSPTKRISILPSVEMAITVLRILGIKSIAFVLRMIQGGASYDFELQRRNEKYLTLVLLAVCNDFKKQGYMNILMNELFDLAEKSKLSIYFDTDAKNKCDRC